MKFITLALLFSFPAHAAWTFEQVLQATLSQHPTLSAKRADVTAAEADVAGARWQRFPALSVEASKQGDGGSGRALRLDQPVWTGGRITSGIALAQARQGMAGAMVEEEKLALTLRVIAVVSEVRRQQLRLGYLDESIRAHDTLLQLIQRRVVQEVSTRADQSLAESRLYAANNDRLQAQQALQTALMQLSQLAGQLVDGLTEQDFAEHGVPATQTEVLTLVMTHSATLRRLQGESLLLDAELQSKQAAYWPQLVVRLENTATDTRAMLVLQAQPGAGLSAKSAVDSVNARREGAAMNQQTAIRELTERVTQDWHEWQSAKVRLENAVRARAMSSEVSESYARQFTAGRKSWIEVLNAVREASQSELAVVDLRMQWLSAGMRLKAMMGKL